MTKVFNINIGVLSMYFYADNFEFKNTSKYCECYSRRLAFVCCLVFLPKILR